MTQSRLGLKSLPFNFILSARHVNGPAANLPFGFEKLDAPDGFGRGELGFSTVFAFRDGKLINGNRALCFHPVEIFPPWPSLWSLKEAGHGTFLELIAISQDLGGRPNYFIEFVSSGKFISLASFSFIHSGVFF